MESAKRETHYQTRLDKLWAALERADNLVVQARWQLYLAVLDGDQASIRHYERVLEEAITLIGERITPVDEHRCGIREPTLFDAIDTLPDVRPAVEETPVRQVRHYTYPIDWPDITE